MILGLIIIAAIIGYFAVAGWLYGEWQKQGQWWRKHGPRDQWGYPGRLTSELAYLWPFTFVVYLKDRGMVEELMAEVRQKEQEELLKKEGLL